MGESASALGTKGFESPCCGSKSTRILNDFNGFSDEIANARRRNVAIRTRLPRWRSSANYLAARLTAIMKAGWSFDTAVVGRDGALGIVAGVARYQPSMRDRERNSGVSLKPGSLLREVDTLLQLGQGLGGRLADGRVTSVFRVEGYQIRQIRQRTSHFVICATASRVSSVDPE